MRLVLKRDWEVLDGSEKGKAVVISQGCHEIERIPCPNGHPCFWLVLKGTLIGASEGSWREWESGDFTERPDHPSYGEIVADHGEWEVVIEE